MGGLTIGAIGAALIAAVVSLIGLILAKEQKTSEFRQEWINKLREEIADYATHVSAISDQLKIKFDDDNEKLKHLALYYLAINRASNAIKLRLNPAENGSKAILSAMSEIENRSTSDQSFSSSDIQVLEDDLIKESQKLLKSEWDRVKTGERTFRIAKMSAMVVLAVLVISLVVAAVMSANGDNEGSSQRPQDQAVEHEVPPAPSRNVAPPDADPSEIETATQPPDSRGSESGVTP